MTFKKLKKIKIAHTTFNIRWDKNQYGGSFDFEEGVIMVGTAGGDSFAFAVLIHELSEILHVITNTRFMKGDAQDYIFVLDHSQFTTHSELLSGLIQEFVN